MAQRLDKAGLQVGVSPTGNTFICSWVEALNVGAKYRSCEPVIENPRPPVTPGAIDI